MAEGAAGDAQATGWLAAGRGRVDGGSGPGEGCKRRNVPSRPGRYRPGGTKMGERVKEAARLDSVMRSREQKNTSRTKKGQERRVQLPARRGG